MPHVHPLTPMKKLSLLLGTLGGAMAGYVFSNAKLRDELSAAKDAEAAAMILGQHMKKDGKKIGKEVWEFIQSNEVQKNLKHAKTFAEKQFKVARKRVDTFMKKEAKVAGKAMKKAVKEARDALKKVIDAIVKAVRNDLNAGFNDNATTTP